MLDKAHQGCFFMEKMLKYGTNMSNRLLLTNGIAFGLIGFFLPLSETAKQGAIILIIMGSLGYLVKERNNIKLDVASLALLSFLFFSLVSMCFSNSYYASIGVEYDYERVIHSFYSLVRILFIYFAFRFIPISESKVEKFLFIVVISYLISLLIGEFNILFKLKKFLELKGVGHVNHSSIYSAIVFFVSLNLTLYSSDKKYIYPIVCILSLCAIFQSGSRGTILSVLLTLVFHFWTGKKNIKNIILVGIVFISVSVIVSYFNNYTALKVKQGFHDPARLFIWNITIKEWLKHNIFFGIGPNNSHYVNPVDYGIVLNKNWKNLGHSHNTFLTILLENGLFGFFSYTIFVSSVIYKSLKSKINNNLFCSIGFDVSMVNFINSFSNTTYISSSNELLLIILWAISLRFSVR